MSTPDGPKVPKVPSNYRQLKGSERARRRGANRVGPADPNEQVLVSVYVRAQAGAPPLPDQSHWAATPPGKRSFLSRAEFARRYQASPADLRVVTDFAKTHGLHVVQTDAGRRLVQLSGTVAQVSEAFGVELSRYEWGTETYRGREGSIYVPDKVADVVEAVFGLDTRKMARRASNIRGETSALVTPQALTPLQVAQLYNFPSSSGAGQTIGILEFGGGYDDSTDIAQFFSGLGLSTPNLTPVGVDGASNSPGDPDADGEIALDIDVAGSVASASSLVVYFAPVGSEQDWVDIFTTAIHDSANNPSVLSCSWGWSELQADAPTGDPSSPWPFEWTAMAMDKMSTTLQAAATMGVTVFCSSGDRGSDNAQGDGQAHVLYPASDPWVTACGGTIITNVSGSSCAEGTWNDSGGGATGGGVSEHFGLPTWQQATGVPLSVNPGNNKGRGVPDVAGNASPNSGYNIIADGAMNQTGGTSAVAPLYAALLALINAELGHAVGYLNPTLYSLAQNPGVFRDINDGVNNQWSGETQPAPFYVSGPGWDGCTGRGVINGAGLLAQLQAS